MKPIKQLLALTIVITLCLTATACSSENIFGVTNPTTPLESSDTADSSQSDSAPVSTEAYRNEYFNFKCVLPEEWYVLNADEVDQVMGTVRDAIGEGDASDVIKKSLDDGTSIMDFYAVSGSGTQTINIVLGKVTLLQRFLSEEQLLEASIPLMSGGLENMGAKNITHTNETVTILGKEHAATFVSAEYQGVSLNERICLILKGSYLSTITITDMAGDPTDDVFAYFQSIN